MKPDLTNMTVEELKHQPEYEKVEGRSSMDKDELVAAMQDVRDGKSTDDDDTDDDDAQNTGLDAPGAEDSGVRDHDANYLGTSPEYQNSATESLAPIVDEEDEVSARVREHVENMVQPGPGEESFAEWNERRNADKAG